MHTSTLTLLIFKVSTCFGHYLPILSRHYMNAELVTTVCSIKLSLTQDDNRSINFLDLTIHRKTPSPLLLFVGPAGTPPITLQPSRPFVL
jgi:hypothetical protein